MKFAIVEDVRSDAEQLKQHLKEYCEEKGLFAEILVFRDALLFLSEYRADYDCVFMDIELPGISGMEGAKKLRKVDPLVPLVFVTSLARYAVKGYQVRALDFIVKPYQPQMIRFAMDAVMKELEKNERGSLSVRCGDETVVIPFSSIEYVEVDGHTVTYHTAEGKFSARGSMKSVEASLPVSLFSRPNAVYLVNLRRVLFVETDYVTVGTARLKMSRAKKKGFVEALRAFIAGGGV